MKTMGTKSNKACNHIPPTYMKVFSAKVSNAYNVEILKVRSQSTSLDATNIDIHSSKAFVYILCLTRMNALRILK